MWGFCSQQWTCTQALEGRAQQRPGKRWTGPLCACPSLEQNYYPDLHPRQRCRYGYTYEPSLVTLLNTIVSVQWAGVGNTTVIREIYLTMRMQTANRIYKTFTHKTLQYSLEYYQSKEQRKRQSCECLWHWPALISTTYVKLDLSLAVSHKKP